MKKNNNDNIMDQIEFGIKVGYFIKEENIVTFNSENKRNFYQFNDLYNNYVKHGKIPN